MRAARRRCPAGTTVARTWRGRARRAPRRRRRRSVAACGASTQERAGGNVVARSEQPVGGRRWIVGVIRLLRPPLRPARRLGRLALPRRRALAQDLGDLGVLARTAVARA